MSQSIDRCCPSAKAIVETVTVHATDHANFLTLVYSVHTLDKGPFRQKVYNFTQSATVAAVFARLKPVRWPNVLLLLGSVLE